MGIQDHFQCFSLSDHTNYHPAVIEPEISLFEQDINLGGIIYLNH